VYASCLNNQRRNTEGVAAFGGCGPGSFKEKRSWSLKKRKSRRATAAAAARAGSLTLVAAVKRAAVERAAAAARAKAAGSPAAVKPAGREAEANGHEFDLN
jgi:hypothetical protein